MKKAMVFVLICLVWGWTPSSETTVISPAAELGTRHVAVTAPRPAGTRAFWSSRGAAVSWGRCECSSRCRLGAGGFCLSPLPTPFSLLWRLSCPIAESGVGVRRKEPPWD